MPAGIQDSRCPTRRLARLANLCQVAGLLHRMAPMTPTPQSDDHSPTTFDRRDFLSRLAGGAALVGAASPTLGLLSIFPEPAATPGSVFRPRSTEPDAAVFAEARKHFL